MATPKTVFAPEGRGDDKRLHYQRTDAVTVCVPNADPQLPAVEVATLPIGTTLLFVATRYSTNDWYAEIDERKCAVGKTREDAIRAVVERWNEQPAKLAA